MGAVENRIVCPMGNRLRDAKDGRRLSWSGKDFDEQDIRLAEGLGGSESVGRQNVAAGTISVTIGRGNRCAFVSLSFDATAADSCAGLWWKMTDRYWVPKSGP